jgi:hypothetical protein
MSKLGIIENGSVAITDEGTVIIDDANPLELSQVVKDKSVDILVGGVKERPIAYKLGIGFCDHNHERKLALEGFEGMYNFAVEVHKTVLSPVWRFTPRMSGTPIGNSPDTCVAPADMTPKAEPSGMMLKGCDMCDDKHLCGTPECPLARDGGPAAKKTTEVAS